MIDQEMQHCRKIVRFDPTISTANQGDFIIRNACEHVLHDCFPVQLSVAVPVRDRLSKVSMKHVGQCGFRICLRDKSAFLRHAPPKDVEYPPAGRGDDALRRFAQAGAAEFPPDS